MKMIRFKEDIPNEDGLVWQRGNIYKILSEDEVNLVISMIKNKCRDFTTLILM